MTTIGRKAVHERLLRHEARLRHGSVDRVDEEQHGVDHRQHALDLAAEVGVARRVDDVDAVVLPLDGSILRQDRDAALALEIVRVHDAVGLRLAQVERAGLAQELIDERRLAVIDVRDDGDVAEVLEHAGSNAMAGAALSANATPGVAISAGTQLRELRSGGQFSSGPTLRTRRISSLWRPMPIGRRTPGITATS
jgi:hypothetical protein